MITYRPEIDGLRAIAILPVILFHAGFDTFSGGFIGVDVFFVISGYLITSIILKEISTGTFSLTRFYERRALRILPALTIVILASIPFAYHWLNAAQLKNFAQSIVAAATFSSNILFLKESDYFDIASELKPLLHTWSLAVEEQFYILFPLFLMATWVRGKRFVLLVLGVCLLASLALSHWMIESNPTAAFYLLPFRAWEILVGVLCAFFLVHKSTVKHPTFANIASSVGLLLIIYSIFMFDMSTAVPGIPGLIPVVGSALIILFANAGTAIYRLLSSRSFVGIGLISYSLYLWHQPVLAFARLASLKELTKLDSALLLILSILLAILTWKYIEQPFRNLKTSYRKHILPLALSTLLLFSFIGIFGHILDGRFGPATILTPNLKWASFSEMVKLNGDVCERQPVPGTNWLLGCYFGNTSAAKTIILYGDSHGQAISYPLDQHLKEQDTRGMMLWIDGCDLVPYTRSRKNLSVTNCEERAAEMFGFIKSMESDVIVSSRWTMRLYPIDGVDLDMPYRNSEGYVELANKGEYDMLINGNFYRDAPTKKRYLSKFIRDLADASKRLILVYSVPETAIDIEKLNRFHYLKHGEILDTITTSYDDYQKRNSFVNSIFDELNLPNLVRIRSDRVFCQDIVRGTCIMQWQRTPFYYDDNHLSFQGAKLLVDEIFQQAFSKYNL